MTTNEILAMEPGNKLDALIAELILGYKITEGCTGEKYFDGFSISKIPSYSKDMTTAWEVVEKMINNSGIDFVLNIRMERLWEAIYYDDGNYLASTSAKTAPEAICKAALLACIKDATQCK